MAMFILLDRLLARIRGEEAGATAVEYGLVVALIAAVVVGAVFLLSLTVDTTVTNVDNCLSNPTAAGC
jgi:pilus assembly protein Flp/PilA